MCDNDDRFQNLRMAVSAQREGDYERAERHFDLATQIDDEEIHEAVKSWEET